MSEADAAANALRTLSLDALRGFEAAARHLSLTRAAEELCLTQSAVSKQVKAIEETIGHALFVRGSRGLSLTAEGRQLHDDVGEALARLQVAVGRLVRSTRRAVSITAPPSFSSLWLAPRLAEFHRLEPAIDVCVDASEANRVLEREGIDLAVRLSRPGRSATGGRLLMHEQLMLVAAPGWAGRIAEPTDLLAVPLLEFDHPAGRMRWMAWPHWYEHWKLARPALQAVFRFSHYDHLLKAAVEGTGIAIGRLPLVLPLLRSGRLEPVLAQTTARGQSYHLVVSARAQHRHEVGRFAEWIEDELAADSRSAVG